MQLRQLKYVLEVYRRGNHISAAADALNTTPAALVAAARELSA